MAASRVQWLAWPCPRQQPPMTPGGLEACRLSSYTGPSKGGRAKGWAWVLHRLVFTAHIMAGLVWFCYPTITTVRVSDAIYSEGIPYWETAGA